MTTATPYAGQAWANNIGHGELNVGSLLTIIARDLADDISAAKGAAGPLELWKHETNGVQGFYVGDTSSLPEQGWTLVATLF